MFITFEGIDGTGKSTVIRHIAERLGDTPALIAKTPGGTTLGEGIRDMLLNPKIHVTPKANVFLFLADMVHLWKETIKPALVEGTVVLCDRYKDSTLIYQVLTADTWHGLSRYLVRNILDEILPDPDLTFILDLPVKEAYRHSRPEEFGEADTFEKAPLEVWEARRQAYLELPKTCGIRKFVTVDVWKKTEEEVAEEVWMHIQTLASSRGANPYPTLVNPLFRGVSAECRN